MNSISRKINVLNLVTIFLCTFIMGGVGFWFTSNSRKDTSDEILSLTCRQETNFLNLEMFEAKQSVDLFSELATGDMPSVEAIRSDSAVRRNYVSRMEKQMSDFARHTSGIGCYYFRIAPELADEVDGDGGFFYVKKKRQDNFSKEPLTRINDFDPSEIERVGWYYGPKVAGHPLWLEPYYNKNVDIYMISYVVPLYKDGQFVGVAGIDLNFNAMIDDISIVNPYKTGYTSLVSREGRIYYHPQYEAGASITDYSPELKELVADMSATGWDSLWKTYSYRHKNKDKILTFSPMNNGMALLLSVESQEIKEPQNELLRIILMASVTMALLAVIINSMVANRITRPLKKITEAADQIAAGNLEVELPEPTNDEVGVLTKSFDVTIKSLKKYISGMQYKAYSDPLTHVKNKAAYDEAKERLKRQMDEGEAEYGLLMLDVNNLKKINDLYGHDRGDDYLVLCCQLICKAFKHSPVYRIGGDEFVVLLENQEYEKREELIGEFDRMAEESFNKQNLWQQVSVAKGLGCCQPSDVSPDEVMKRADLAMYEDKKRMKVTR